MYKYVLLLTFTIALFFNPTQTIAANEDGIWQSQAGNFVSIHKNQNNYLIVIALDQDGYFWMAYGGQLNGLRADPISTIAGSNAFTASYYVEFTSVDTATAIQISCEMLDPMETCTNPNGSIEYYTKVFGEMPVIAGLEWL